MNSGNLLVVIIFDLSVLGHSEYMFERIEPLVPLLARGGNQIDCFDVILQIDRQTLIFIHESDAGLLSLLTVGKILKVVCLHSFDHRLESVQTGYKNSSQLFTALTYNHLLSNFFFLLKRNFFFSDPMVSLRLLRLSSTLTRLALALRSIRSACLK